MCRSLRFRGYRFKNLRREMDIKTVANAAFGMYLEAAKQSFDKGEYFSADKLLGTARELLAELAEEKPVATPSEVNKAKLIRVLEANDWNVALVSRELGVTRRTLYMRMAAFEIERKKVPRLAKPI